MVGRGGARASTGHEGDWAIEWGRRDVAGLGGRRSANGGLEEKTDAAELKWVKYASAKVHTCSSARVRVASTVDEPVAVLEMQKASEGGRCWTQQLARSSERIRSGKAALAFASSNSCSGSRSAHSSLHRESGISPRGRSTAAACNTGNGGHGRP